MQEIIAADWDVLNHSYSHAAYGDTDYNYQITENQNAVLEKAAYEMTHFVIPSGDLNYVDPAFSLGMQAVYSNKFDFLGYGTGIDIDSPFNTENLKIYRRYMYDDAFNTSNIMDKLNEVTEQSQNGNHIWWHDFTHRVIPTPTGGSLVWDTFKYYMQEIAEVYGIEGSDRIWFAPPTEILNYLKIRENTGLNFEKAENTVTVYLNTSEIPTNFDDYFLSLNISADAELLSINPQFGANVSFANTSATEKLINIEWSQPTMKRMQAIDISTSIEEINDFSISIYPNPINTPRLNVDINSATAEEYDIQLISTLGQKVFSRFFNGKAGQNSFALQLPQLQAGVYYLRIQNENQIIKMEKILIH